jgi:hypothetical protein
VNDRIGLLVPVIRHDLYYSGSASKAKMAAVHLNTPGKFAMMITDEGCRSAAKTGSANKC